MGVLNLLSGGAVSNFSVLANGVYPYITASIIFQLLIPIVPALERIQREPGGREKLQRYTYYLAIPMAVLQSLGQIAIFNAPNIGGGGVIPGFGVDLFLTATVIVTMTAGTMFAIWLGDLITEQGIGNGLSVIIFAGIVAQAPGSWRICLTTSNRLVYDIWLFVLITLFEHRGHHLHPGGRGGASRCNMASGCAGGKQYGGASTHIPLKVNPVGMIPLIFAQAVTAFPAIIVNLFPQGAVGDSILNVFGNQQGFGYWGLLLHADGRLHLLYASVMVGNQNLARICSAMAVSSREFAPGGARRNTSCASRTASRSWARSFWGRSPSCRAWSRD